MKSPTASDMTKKTLLLYWRSVWRYPKTVVGIAILLPLTILVNQILPPVIVATVLNRLSTHEFTVHNVWASFGPSLLAYAGLTLFGGIVMWRVVDVLVWTLEGRVERDMAQAVFEHLTSQSAKFHADHFGGSLVSQTNKLMGSYIRFADTTAFQVLPLLSGLFFSALILLSRATVFAVILVCFSIFYMATAFVVSRHVRRLGAAQAEAESTQTGFLADVVTNVMTVKSFSSSQYENKRFADATTTTYRRLLELMRGSQKQMIYFSSLMGLISALSLTVAAISVVNFGVTLGTVFLILSYTSTITGQLFTFSTNSLRNYNRSIGDASPMVEILSYQPEIRDPTAPEPLRITHGAIAFNDVHFTHDGSTDALFRGFDLHIKPGEKVGLVGHSGSGKTTFTRLVLRFSDIDSGTITIDDQDITKITQDDLRSVIAYVPQEPMLFHRTIRENISYGQPSANAATIERTAKMAHAHDFIMTLPKGYDTLVGERGVKLSGGQRQRIAIARAMLKNAPVLLLDEATSALDSESEGLIQDALWKLMEGRTAIVIAHRLSTIQHMDRIVVMDRGQIVEQGSHKDLLSNTHGTYARLWQHQSGGFIEE